MFRREIIALLVGTSVITAGHTIPKRIVGPLDSPMFIKGKSESLEQIVNKFLPQGAVILNPQKPQESKGIQLRDIDGDGKNEILALYIINGMPSDLGMFILKQESDGKWSKIFETKAKGPGIDYLSFEDVTGDGKTEILLGWIEGAVWNELNIFKFEDGQVKKIASDFYSKIDVEDMPDEKGRRDGKAEIALWKHVTGEAYKVDVFRWNGTQLVPAKDVYPYYFKRVVKYYEEKIKELPDAAFYWYYLADAQIKVGDYKDAIFSINKGLEIIGKHPDYYPGRSKFEELKKLLPK